MLQNNQTPHDRFINKSILDEYDGMVKKFIEGGMPEEVAIAKTIKMQKAKYNKL